MGDRGWSRHECTVVAGWRMHAAAFGPTGGRELVCVPGLGVSHRYYLRLARALAPGIRTVAVDLPGFGRSSGPPQGLDVRGLSDALAGWMHATGRVGTAVLANSAGCQVVIDRAYREPGLAGPLVLIGPTMDRTARSPLRQIGRLLLDVRYEPPSIWLIFARDYLPFGIRRAVRTLRHLLADPVEQKLSGVGVPAVVVRGEHDPIAPRRWTADVAAGLPNGSWVEVSGAGHVTHYGDPRAVARIVSDLLAGTTD